ncbi:unnamed protein product [marine sediment metagenome]|uniref:Uncharacterized protein n=1 Tax=marine sediment metagenome TaxID=412755 RepID=X1QWG1_9ZZZZ
MTRILQRTTIEKILEGEEAVAGRAKEKVTRVKMSWESFLLATSTGALAISAIAGVHFRCPVCEHEMGLTVKAVDMIGEDESSK